MLEELAFQEYGKTKEMVIEYEDKYLAEMEAMGVKITTPDIEAFREATAYLYSDEATTGGADFLTLRDELYAQMGIEGGADGCPGGRHPAGAEGFGRRRGLRRGPPRPSPKACP